MFTNIIDPVNENFCSTAVRVLKDIPIGVKLTISKRFFKIKEKRKCSTRTFMFKM